MENKLWLYREIVRRYTPCPGRCHWQRCMPSSIPISFLRSPTILFISIFQGHFPWKDYSPRQPTNNTIPRSCLRHRWNLFLQGNLRIPMQPRTLEETNIDKPSFSCSFQTHKRIPLEQKPITIIENSSTK